jgi:hypothetical protein
MKLTYDKWKTTDPDAEFLGDNQQAGERREGVMSEEERMAELEGDIVESEKWIQRVEAENSQLRELNAELLGALIKLSNEALASVELARPCIGNTNANCVLTRVTEARELIAKAEKLK